MHLRQVRPSYVLLTNNPDQANGEKRGVINLRKQPFHVSFIFLKFFGLTVRLFAFFIDLKSNIPSFPLCFIIPPSLFTFIY